MVWLKSLVAGVAGVMLVVILGVFTIPLVLRFRTGQTVAWDPISVIRHTVAWVILGLGFLVGFLWEYRRLSH